VDEAPKNTGPAPLLLVLGFMLTPLAIAGALTEPHYAVGWAIAAWLGFAMFVGGLLIEVTVYG